MRNFHQNANIVVRKESTPTTQSTSRNTSTENDPQPSTSGEMNTVQNKIHKPDHVIIGDLTIKTAIKNNLKIYDVPINDNEIDPILCLQNNAELVKLILNYILSNSVRGIKWYIIMCIQFVKRDRTGELLYVSPHFHGECRIMLNDSEFSINYRETMAKILSSISQFQREGSDWTIHKVESIKVHSAKYRPLRANSFIPTPIRLRYKKAIINVENNDDKCFMYAILSSLFPQRINSNRMSRYKSHINHLKFGDIKFPVQIKDISKFEKLNNLSINVFVYGKHIYPLRITEKRNGRKHVNLLILSEGKTKHYCLIKNMSALLREQSHATNTLYYCDYCLHGFRSEQNQIKHRVVCKRFGAQKTMLPTAINNIITFNNRYKEKRHPFVIYADFECLISDISHCSNNSDLSFTDKMAQHIPCGFSYKVVGYDKKTTENIVTYRGHNAGAVFITHMEAIEKRLLKILYDVVPIILTAQEKELCEKSFICHICGDQIIDDKVKDHCHITGKFIGVAHNKCNINYELPKYIPVIFHNLKGYDAHIILNAVRSSKMKISCIPINMEKYMSFSLGALRFIDSLQFLNASLSKLVLNMDKNNLKFIKEYISNNYNGDNQYKFSLLSQKGQYPYEYMQSFDQFHEKKLPNIKSFYSTLTKSNISEDDYDHAEKVWKTFNISNMGEYHDLYLASDVLLLADVFERFREMCLDYYTLDPCHYFTSPGLSWDACLRMTNVKLELLSDIDQHLFIESGIRGGVATISCRHAESNNPYNDNYDSNNASNYIIYLDANNLYGYSMIQYLPVGGFRWLSVLEQNTFVLENIGDDSDDGYILEVDLSYPNKIHDDHNDFPLAPESMEIKYDMLSKYQIQLLELLEIKHSNSKKLIPNLLCKNNYIVHYRNLKLYISLGMEITKIHKILTFRQSPWMQKYIQFNTEKRRICENEFERDFFKLLNNSIYGKSLQNQRKQVNIQLINNEAKLMKLTAKPGFKSFKIFSKYLAAIQCEKQSILLNKPIYVGFTILELSKCLMYDFHYNTIKKMYGEKATLLFTDTDSLCYNITTNDVYKDMESNQEQYDFSNYPENHFLHNKSNMKKLGKFKDETASKPITEFVGLRSKMYSFKYDQIEKKVAKGVSRSTIKHNLNHDMYKDSLKNKNIKINSMIRFQSYNHVVYSVNQNKKTLSPFDDKRYILDNGVDTLAYGHYSII